MSETLKITVNQLACGKTYHKVFYIVSSIYVEKKI